MTHDRRSTIPSYLQAARVHGGPGAAHVAVARRVWILRHRPGCRSRQENAAYLRQDGSQLPDAYAHGYTGTPARRTAASDTAAPHAGLVRVLLRTRALHHIFRPRPGAKFRLDTG